MSAINEFLETTDREAALEALREEQAYMNRKEVRAQLRAIAAAHESDDVYRDLRVPGEEEVLASDTACIQALYMLKDADGEGSTDWIAMERCSWLFAHALDRLRSLHDRPSEFAEAHVEFLRVVDGWIERRPSEIEPHASLIASCLVELGQLLLNRYQSGSRAIVGTILMLTREAEGYLPLLRSEKGPSQYDFDGILVACREMAAVDPADPYGWGTRGLSERFNRPFEFQEEERESLRWISERFVPAIGLCHGFFYQEILDTLVDWCRWESPTPFGGIMGRDTTSVARRIGQEAADRILQEINESA